MIVCVCLLCVVCVLIFPFLESLFVTDNELSLRLDIAQANERTVEFPT